MVVDKNYHQGNLDESQLESLQKRFAMYSESKEKADGIPQSIREDTVVEFHGESASPEDEKVYVNDANCEMKDTLAVPMEVNSKQDTYSIASSFSTASSSSSLSSMGLAYESERRLSASPLDQKVVKSFGPANETENSQIRNQTQVHPRIRRVPSTANPKYRVPNLQKNQRSKSQPHIHVNHLLNQRRNSSPSQINCLPNVHSKNLKPNTPMNPNFNNSSFQQSQDQQQQQNPQQQIIYLQIPQPSQSQLCDPQSLQQQISSQLQLLVPQIYSQLVNQINVTPAQLNTVKVNLNNSNVNKTSLESGSEIKDPSEDSSNTYLTSNFTVEGNQSQRVMNQVFQHNTLAKNSQVQKPQQSQQQKRQKSNNNQRQSNLQRGPSLENLGENDNPNKYLHINDLSQILQHIPPHLLQQNQSNAEPSYIEIQQVPGYPKITIPLTQELLLQCQQLQQLREPGFTPYQPRLETILEESLSVKHLKVSRFSKTKIVACILTVLCVIVVILLAGDKTVAVAVVAAIFIIFLLGATFYLYTHSTKSELEDSPKIQVSALSNCDKPTLV